jgi:hypothetical protein
VSILDWVLTGFLFLGALSGWAFMYIYTRRWHWWKDEYGAHLGYFTLSLTLIMTLYVFRPFIDKTWFDILRAPLFVAVVACMVWRLILALVSERRTRLEDVE